MMENMKGGRRDPDSDKCSTTGGEECSVTSTVRASSPTLGGGGGGYSCDEFRPNAPKFGTVVPNRIFVGGIPDTVSVTELEQLFSRYGRVVQAKIIVDRGGVPKGYGFITFETDEEAKNIQMDSNVILREKRLNIAPAIKKQMSDRIYPGFMSPIVMSAAESPVSPSGGGDNTAQMNGNGGGQMDHPPTGGYSMAPPQFYPPRRDETTYFVPPVYYGPYQGPAYHALPNGYDASPQLLFPGYQGPHPNLSFPFQPMCFAPLPPPIINESRESAPMTPPVFPYPCIYGGPTSPPTTNSSYPETGSGGSEASSYYEPTSDSYVRGPDQSAGHIIYYYNIVPPPMTTIYSNNLQNSSNLLAITDASDVKKTAELNSPTPPSSELPQRVVENNVANAVAQTPTSDAGGPTPLLSVTPFNRHDYSMKLQQEEQQRMCNRPDESYARGGGGGGVGNRGNFGRGMSRGSGSKRGGMMSNGGGGGRSYDQSVNNNNNINNNNNNSTSCPNNYECDKKKGVDSVRGGRGGGAFPSYYNNQSSRPTNNFPRPIHPDRPSRPSNIRFFQPNYSGGGGEYHYNSMDAHRFFSGYGGANRRGHGGRSRWHGHSFSRGGGQASRYNPRGYGKMRSEGDSELGGDIKDVENGVLTPPITPRSPRAGSPDGFTVGGTAVGSSIASDVDSCQDSIAALEI